MRAWVAVVPSPGLWLRCPPPTTTGHFLYTRRTPGTGPQHSVRRATGGSGRTALEHYTYTVVYIYTARIALALLEIVVRKTLQLPSWKPLALVETIASKKVNTGRKNKIANFKIVQDLLRYTQYGYIQHLTIVQTSLI